MEKIDSLIPPSSISEIENMSVMSSQEQCSKLQGLFFTKNKQQSVDNNPNTHYKIKIKGPQRFEYHDNEKNQDKSLALSDDQGQPHITPQLFPLKQNITGYQISRDAFSEQQILQAFQVIDINKDESITEQDIVFFLQYMKQPFKMEEVKQMINLLSIDGSKVTFEDFKKLGQGSLIPLANYKIPDKKWKNKQKIFQNIKNSQLFNLECPSDVIDAIKSQKISELKYQESKKQATHILTQKIQNLDDFSKMQKFIDLKTQEDFKARRKLFLNISLININQAIQNYKQFEDRNINFIQISKILQINQKEAILLFGQKQISSKYVIMDAIAHSQLKKIHKLQLCLQLINKKNTINLKQLDYIIQFLKGKDDSIMKKILTLFKNRGIKKEQQIKKYDALEMIQSFSSMFIF